MVILGFGNRRTKTSPFHINVTIGTNCENSAVLIDHRIRPSRQKEKLNR